MRLDRSSRYVLVAFPRAKYKSNVSFSKLDSGSIIDTEVKKDDTQIPALQVKDLLPAAPQQKVLARYSIPTGLKEKAQVVITGEALSVEHFDAL